MSSDSAANGDHASAPAGVVVPIRAFAGGHSRLGGAIDDTARADLARELASRVLAAAAPFPVVVVSDAPEVREWAIEAGAAVRDDPGGLDASARAGLAWCREHNLRRAVVAHADLPWARTFAGVLHDGSRPIAVVVPCHRDDGTPVLSVPATVEFPFAYGAGSFRRHITIARGLGLGVRVVRDQNLAFDVDVPADLDRLAPTSATPR